MEDRKDLLIVCLISVRLFKIVLLHAKDSSTLAKIDAKHCQETMKAIIYFSAKIRLVPFVSHHTRKPVILDIFKSLTYRGQR